MHDEQQVLTDKLRLGESQAAQPLGTSSLHEFEVVDVIDDTARIGVLVIDSTAVGEDFSSSAY